MIAHLPSHLAMATLMALIIAFVLLPSGGTLGLPGVPDGSGHPQVVKCETERTYGSSHTAGGGGLMARVSPAEMTGRSSRIVMGTVERLQGCLTNGGSSIVTLVSIAPEQVLKGGEMEDASDGLVTVIVPGGDYGDYRLNVGTSPEFTVGERVVIFLRQIPNMGDVLTEGFQSKLSVGADGMVSGLGLPAEFWTQKIGLASAGDQATEGDRQHEDRATVESAFAVEDFKWSTDDIPVRIWINAETGRPGQVSGEEFRMAAANAMHTWQNVPESFIAFGPVSRTTRVSGADGCSEAENPDGFNDITWGIASDPLHADSTLQITFQCFNAVTNELNDTDIEIDTDHVGADWRVDGSGACGSDLFDLESVILHELGHLLGIGHPTAFVCTVGVEEDKCPVMNLNNMGVLRDLCADDIAGAASIYPTNGGPPPDAPLDLTALATNSIELSWSDVADEIGFEVWRAVGGCAEVGPEEFVLVDSVDDGVTSYTDSNYGDGLTQEQAYCYKVRAFSTDGDSEFSNSAEATEGVIPRLQGDVDCDGDIDSVDALKQQRFVVGLSVSQAESCPDIGSEFASLFGDVDCDGDVDSVDALKVQRFVVGLSVSQIEPCPDIGEQVEA